MFPTGGPPPYEPLEPLNPAAAEYCRLEKVEACRVSLRRRARAGCGLRAMAAKLIRLLDRVWRRAAVRRLPKGEPLASVPPKAKADPRKIIVTGSEVRPRR
jgi:hypothetical protein